MQMPRSARARLVFGPAILFFAALVFWGWQVTRPGIPIPAPLAAAMSATHARRIDITLADVEAGFTRLMAENHLASYVPVPHRFFVGSTPSRCLGAELVTGAFYCRSELAFDLGFFAALTPQLRETEDIASKLLIATIAAAALQDQLGILDAVADLPEHNAHDREVARLALALQAACLAGLWAAETGPRLGPLPPGLYAAAIQGARRVAVARQGAGTGGPATLDNLDIGTRFERETAFRRGQETGLLSECLLIDPAGAPAREEK